jgi:hypothetical protein
MATPRKADARPHARFVDALRECLGLDPLYSDHAHRTDAERFARPPLTDGNRRVERLQV